MYVILLIISFVVILYGAKLFTNAVEWAGLRLGLGEGAVGSILAAVGTALPETMIAIVAIIAGSAYSKDVAIGAIIGAPFMLATIAMVVVGVSALAFAKRRPQGDRLKVAEKVGLRDLTFFIFAFSAAFVSGLVHSHFFHWSLAAVLVIAYLVYFVRTLKTEGEMSAEIEPLTFARKPGTPAAALVFFQLLISLGLIIAGAQIFVDELIEIAKRLGADPLVLSLILAPLATELPEKANSVIWVRDGKDTYAIGNISGAMVFQSTLPVSIGLIFTNWRLDDIALLSIGLGLAGAVVASAYLKIKGAIEKPAILMAGMLYAVFVAYIAL